MKPRFENYNEMMQEAKSLAEALITQSNNAHEFILMMAGVYTGIQLMYGEETATRMKGDLDNYVEFYLLPKIQKAIAEVEAGKEAEIDKDN